MMRRFSLTQKNVVSHSNLVNTTFGINYLKQDASQSKRSSLQKSISRSKSNLKNKLSTTKHKKSQNLSSKITSLNSTQNLANRRNSFSIKVLDAQDQADQLFLQIKNILENNKSLLNKHQRIRIKQWLKILSGTMYNQTWKQNRNFYLKILIIMLQNHQIIYPFSTIPHEGPLPKLNLCDIPFSVKQRLIKKYPSSTDKSLQKLRSKSRSFSKSLSKTNKLDISIAKQKTHTTNLSKQKTSAYKHNLTQKLSFSKQNDPSFANQHQSSLNLSEIKSKSQFKQKKQQFKNMDSNISSSFNFYENQYHVHQNSNNFPHHLFKQQNNYSNQSHNQYYFLQKNPTKLSKYLSEKPKISDSGKGFYQCKENGYFFKTNNNYTTMKTDDQHVLSKYHAISQSKEQIQQNNSMKQNNSSYHLFQGIKVLQEIKSYLMSKKKIFNRNQQYFSIFSKVNRKLYELEQQFSKKTKNSISLNQQFQQISCNLKQKISKTGLQTMQFLNFLGKYNSNSNQS